MARRPDLTRRCILPPARTCRTISCLLRNVYGQQQPWVQAELCWTADAVSQLSDLHDTAVSRAAYQSSLNRRAASPWFWCSWFDQHATYSQPGCLTLLRRLRCLRRVKPGEGRMSCVKGVWWGEDRGLAPHRRRVIGPSLSFV